MGRAFGTNITNTVGTVASKPNPKVVQNRSLSTSSLQTNVVIKHEFQNESSMMNHQNMTSSVLKPKPVFACAPIGNCLNQFSSHDRTSGLTSTSNSQPIKSSQCLTPTLGRSLSDSGFGSIPRLKLRQMPNILRRKRKSSSGSVFNSTPTEVSISTTPIISNRNDFWPFRHPINPFWHCHWFGWPHLTPGSLEMTIMTLEWSECRKIGMYIVLLSKDFFMVFITFGIFPISNQSEYQLSWEL